METRRGVEVQFTTQISPQIIALSLNCARRSGAGSNASTLTPGSDEVVWQAQPPAAPARPTIV